MKKTKVEKFLGKIRKNFLIKRSIYLVVGIFILAVSYNLFFLSNNIVYGGISGISIITKEYIDPVILILIVSSILIVISYILLDKKQTNNSILGSLLFPLFVKLTSNIGEYIPIQNTDLLLIAIFGGVCVGIGSGMVFKTGFTTGGTDIVNQIVSKYFKVSIGTSMLIIDGSIVLLGGFAFGWTRVMYAIIVLYIKSIMVDKVVLGISSSKALYIMSSKDEIIKEYLIGNLKYGITIIETRGGYTNYKQNLFMCVVPTSQYFEVKEGIKEIDDSATIIITDAYQTLGINKHKLSEEQ